MNYCLHYVEGKWYKKTNLFIKSYVVFNEVESNYFYLTYLDEIFALARSKNNLFTIPIFWGSSQKLTLFTMASHWNLLKKCKISRFPYIFCISTLGISFSFKCMKTIVKSHQMVKFKKMFTTWFCPGIISKLSFFLQKLAYGVYIEL